jgi:HK97 family phage major capsid protein
VTPEEMLKEAQKALDALREGHEKLEKGMISQGEFKELQEKTTKALEAQEDANQKSLLAFKEAETKSVELNEKLEKLEKHLIANSNGSKKVDYKDSEEVKALGDALRFHGPDEIRVLQEITKAVNRTDIDTQGGYLVPELMANEIIKDITEISAMRSLARVMTIGGKSISLPTRKTLLEAFFEGETEEGQDGNSTYGSETVTPYRLSVTVGTTNDMLMNSAFNFELDIQTDAVEAFAFKEGDKFVNGDGVKKPEGIITNAAVIAGALTSASSGVVTFDDTINLSGQLKTGYNGTYSFNRATNANLRTLKDSGGAYLWQVQGGGSFNTLNGFDYVLDNALPNIAAGAIPILFADFFKGYRIVDRTAMAVVRDDVTQKKRAIIELTFHKWLTGQVVQAEAIKGLKIKA